MDQEAEEGKDKAGPDKQGKAPQVFEHAVWMGSLTGNGVLLCSRGTRGGYDHSQGGSLQHRGVWSHPPSKFL